MQLPDQGSDASNVEHLVLGTVLRRSDRAELPALIGPAESNAGVVADLQRDLEELQVVGKPRPSTAELTRLSERPGSGSRSA